MIHYLQLTPFNLKKCVLCFFVFIASCLLLADNCDANEPAKYILENGLTLIIKEAPGTGLVAASVFIKASTLNETPQTAGISGMVGSMLLSGTKVMSAEGIAERLESAASRVSIENTPDFTEISYLSLPEDFESGLAILGDILNNSSFPQEEIEKQKSLTISSIKQIDDHPDSLIYNELTSQLYKNHPYGIKPQGKILNIKNFTRRQLIEFYKNYYKPENIVIAIAGDITKYDAYNFCNNFIKFDRVELSKKIAENPSKISGNKQKYINKSNLAANWLEIGFLGPSFTDSDYAAAKALISILGSGMSSRLFVEIREKEGLVYLIDGFLPSRIQKSHLVIHAVSSPKNVLKVKNLIFKEVQKIKNELVSDQELTKCKSSINGKFIMNHQELSKQSWHIGWFEIMGIGYEMDGRFMELINRVSPEDIQYAAIKYLNNYRAIILGPMK